MERHTLIVHPPGAESPDSKLPNARRHGRVRCHMVESSLGAVLDISASGLRVGSGMLRYKPESLVTLEVHTHDGRFDVLARVSWSKSTGFLSSEMGLEFIDLPKEARRILLATVHSSRG